MDGKRQMGTDREEKDREKRHRGTDRGEETERRDIAGET
jgi:hypothetical protein